MWRRKRILVQSSFSVKSYSVGSAFRQQIGLPVGMLHREQKSLPRPLPDCWPSWIWWEMEWEFKAQYVWLKLQHSGHLMWRADSVEKTLLLGKIESRRRRGHQDERGWMASLTQWTWVWARPLPGDGDGQGRLMCYSPWGCKQLDTT